MYNKLALNLLGKYLICIIMCFLTFFSFTAIFAMNSPLDIIGQEVAVYETKESEETLDYYVHYFKDGTDTKLAEYKAKGYVIATRDITGGLKGTPAIISSLISQIVSLVFFIMIVPRVLHAEGSGDVNRVSCGRAEEDKLKGLKAAIPLAAIQFISWVLLILSKFGVIKFGFTVYNFVNYHLYGYQKLIFSGINSTKDISFLSLILALLPVLLTLVVCYLTYLLAYKDINLYERLVYKKNK